MSCFSPACARFGKVSLPSVGFVLVGMESALQCQGVLVVLTCLWDQTSIASLDAAAILIVLVHR